MRRALLLIGILIFTTPTLWAQPVYKSVDKEGNITYSSTPPDDAQHVEETGIVSSPTESNAGSSDDIERVKQAADELERDRKARESKRAAQKEAAEVQEKQKTPEDKSVIQRHRPIIQQPIPPAAGKPTPLPTPVVPVQPSPSPPVAVPLGGGTSN